MALHASWLATIALLGWDRPVSPGWLTFFIMLQGARIWVLTTLGRRWTTRIIVIDAAPIRSGPFRFARHPNYIVVLLEIFAAPMVLNLPLVAVVFSGLNALVLSIRARAENAAWAGRR